MLEPDAVAREYADEEAFCERSAGVRDLVEGMCDEDVLRERLRALRPRRLLDVGAGPAGLSVWAQAVLGSRVVALDSSPRMVELARAAGVAAVQGDMRALPFPDGS